MPKNNEPLIIEIRHAKTVVAALASFGLSAPAIAEITGLKKSTINAMIETKPKKAIDTERLWQKLEDSKNNIADFAEMLYDFTGQERNKL